MEEIQTALYTKALNYRDSHITEVTDMQRNVRGEVIASTFDKLAKKNIIHANKAANLKSGLAMHIASL